MGEQNKLDLRTAAVLVNGERRLVNGERRPHYYRYRTGTVVQTAVGIHLQTILSAAFFCCLVLELRAMTI